MSLNYTESLGRQFNNDLLKQGAGKRVNTPSLRASVRTTATGHLELFRENRGNLFSSRSTVPEGKTESREY